MLVTSIIKNFVLEAQASSRAESAEPLYTPSPLQDLAGGQFTFSSSPPVHEIELIEQE